MGKGAAYFLQVAYNKNHVCHVLQFIKTLHQHSRFVTPDYASPIGRFCLPTSLVGKVSAIHFLVLEVVGYEYGNEECPSMWPYTSWISLVYLQVFHVYPLSKYLFDIHRRAFLTYIYFWIIFYDTCWIHVAWKKTPTQGRNSATDLSGSGGPSVCCRVGTSHGPGPWGDKFHQWAFLILRHIKNVHFTIPIFFFFSKEPFWCNIIPDHYYCSLCFFLALWNRSESSPAENTPGAVQVEHTQLHTVIQVDHRALAMRSKTAPQHEHLWRYPNLLG